MNSSRARQSDLLRQARAVLDLNWTGSFTKPALRQYPHQWSWDSAFVAMGYARYDQGRAQQVLRSLFDAQWSDGRVPHIVFHDADPAAPYFSGPGFWQVERSPHAPTGRQTALSSRLSTPAPCCTSSTTRLTKRKRWPSRLR